MSVADTFERSMLDLINQERTSRGLEPLRLELRLNDSSEDHSDWMIQADTFSHTGVGGSNAGQRMTSSGFDFSGGYGWAENIALQSERGASGVGDDVADLHASLMNSPGHRANILNPDFEVVGIGVERGDYNGWDAVVVTQNFAYTSAALQLDGPGGSADSVVSRSALPTANDQTASSGATALADVLSLDAPGVLNGYAGDDELTGSAGADRLLGGMGDDRISAGGGNDEINGGLGSDVLSGGAGHDEIYGKADGDVIDGGSGNDKVWLGWGNDRAYGGVGDDVLRGSGGNDTLSGGEGNDTVLGGKAHDGLSGDGGQDLLKGWSGNDHLDGGAGDDVLNGGTGSDTFVFSLGRDIVIDFDATDGSERIDLRNAASIESFDDLRSDHMNQFGGHVVIEDSAGDSMVLRDVQIENLDGGDFIF